MLRCHGKSDHFQIILYLIEGYKWRFVVEDSTQRGLKLTKIGKIEIGTINQDLTERKEFSKRRPLGEDHR